jgi:hypothetical protein
MKTVDTALKLSAIFILLVSLSSAISSCDEDEPGPPVITSFSPESAMPGTSVTITGANFSATPESNIVQFNGADATVATASAKELVVTVPPPATIGKITVTVAGRTATSATDFTIPEPSITGFSPASAVVGTSVIIAGANFSTVINENIVKFNGVDATVSAASATQVTVTVPATATTGKITITVHGRNSTSATDFTVPAPTITSYFPPIAASGRSVVIAGTNFSSTAGNNIVKFNGVDATVTAATSTQLTATVPAGASTGAISVNVGPNAATASGNFEICTGAAEVVISDIVLGNSASSTSYTVRFTLTNTGSVNADVTKMSMQNYASVDAAVGNDVGASGFSLTSAGVLAPGQSFTTNNFVCNIGGNKTSHPYLILTIYDSPDGAVTECNTANNVVIKAFNP